jgi:hypothetical protein
MAEACGVPFSNNSDPRRRDPAGATPPAKPHRSPFRQGIVPSISPSAAPPRVPPPVVVSPDQVPDRRGAVAFLSHTKREGEWALPREFRIVSFMGNVELDLTTVRIGTGESHIDIRCVFGNVEITVPPEIRVEVEGNPLVGSFETTRSAPSAHSADAPLLRVSGSAIFGAVTVKVVDPNAPGFFEKLKRALGQGKTEG